MIRFKEGVRLNPRSPAILRLLTAVEDVSEALLRDLTITSGHDGAHAVGSAHYRDEAIDLRVHDVERPQQLAERMQAALGPKFYVVLEDIGQANEHLHAQLRKGETFP